MKKNVHQKFLLFSCIFTEDHYMPQISDMANQFEADGLESITCSIKDVNRAGTNYCVVEDFDKIKWDSAYDFNMSSVEVQQYMYGTCREMANNDYLSYSSGVCRLVFVCNDTMSKNMTVPFNGSDALDEQNALFAQFLYNSSVGRFDDYFVCIQTPHESDDGNYYIKYYSFFIFVDLTFASTTAQKQVIDDWQDWLDDAFTDSSLGSGSVCNPLPISSTWTWLASQSAVQIAFVVLLLSTHNWFVAMYVFTDKLAVISCGLSVISIAENNNETDKTEGNNNNNVSAGSKWGFGAKFGSKNNNNTRSTDNNNGEIGASVTKAPATKAPPANPWSSSRNNNNTGNNGGSKTTGGVVVGGCGISVDDVYSSKLANKNSFQLGYHKFVITILLFTCMLLFGVFGMNKCEQLLLMISFFENDRVGESDCELIDTVKPLINDGYNQGYSLFILGLFGIIITLTIHLFFYIILVH